MWQQTFHSDGTKKSGSSGTYDSDFFSQDSEGLGTKIRGKVGSQLTGLQVYRLATCKPVNLTTYKHSKRGVINRRNFKIRNYLCVAKTAELE